MVPGLGGGCQQSPASAWHAFAPGCVRLCHLVKMEHISVESLVFHGTSEHHSYLLLCLIDNKIVKRGVEVEVLSDRFLLSL